MTWACVTWTLEGVNRSRALGELPPMHAVALRLRDNNFDHHVIAVALDIEDVQVPTLLRIAEAKLARLMDLKLRRGDVEEGG
jgi:hypothetical protein